MCALHSGSAELACRIAGVRLANPLVLASGIWGTSPTLLERAARGGAGAVTAKTCTLSARRGHRNPTAIDWGHGMINAMGLPNPGVEEEVALLREAARRLAPLGVPLIASISADTAEGFAQAAAMVSRAGPAMIEVNISCPNVQSDHGEMFASSAEAAVRSHAAGQGRDEHPLHREALPECSRHRPHSGARWRQRAPMPSPPSTPCPGMLVDAESGAPVLDNLSGGISGPALKPIALRCVHEIASAVQVPLIGTGGVLTGIDAVEMISAGATCVGVGSAIFYRGENAFSLIRDELSRWLIDRGRTLEEIRGRTRCARDAERPTNPPPVPGGEAPDGR